MKTLLLVCACALSIASIGAAQDTPHYEAFVGGSFLRVHASGAELTELLNLPDYGYEPHNMNFNLYGWDASITENVNRWLGGEIEASGYYGTVNAGFLIPASQILSPSPNFTKGVPVRTQYQNFLFGPRFTLRKNGKVVYFAHVLVGLTHVNTSLSESAVVATDFASVPQGTLKAGTGLAVSPGMGIEFRLGERLMIRPIQVDYLMTRVFGERQDNARVSAGLNFTFGQK